MDAVRALWLLIATIVIPSFSQARYMVKDKPLEDNDLAAMTSDTYKLEIYERKVEDDSSIMNTYDQTLLVYEYTIKNDETMTDDEYIPVVTEQLEDIQEAMTTDKDVIRTPKVIETTGVPTKLEGRNRKPERPNEDKETARTNRSNISRSKKRHNIVKRDPREWETQQYGYY